MFTILRRMPKPVAVLAALLTIFTISAGAAYAYWRTTGSGSGSAATGTMTIQLTAATGDTPGSTLIPGGTADVVVHFNNTNGFAVTLTDLVANGTITASCTTPATTFNDLHGLSINVPTGSTAISVPGAVTMGANASSDCQGKSFTVPVTATVKK